MGESLVLLARMRASIGPLLLAARRTVKKWDEEYKTTGKRQNLYWPLKNVISPLDKLATTVENEFLLVVAAALEFERQKAFDAGRVEGVEQYRARMREKRRKEIDDGDDQPVVAPKGRTKKVLRA